MATGLGKACTSPAVCDAANCCSTQQFPILLLGAGELARLLTALVALAEDLGLGFGTNIVYHL